MVVQPAHGIVLFGGEYEANLEEGVAVLGDTWIWDGTSWTQLDVKGPDARSHAAIGSFQGKLYLFGGMPGTSEYLADTWTFDGSTWTRIPAAGPGERVSAHLESLSGKLYLFGGDPSGAAWLTDAWTFQGSTWSLVGVTLPGISNGGGGTSLPFQFTASLPSSIWLFGSLDSRNEVQGTAWRFDGAAWSLFGGLSTSEPNGRYAAAVCSLGRRMLVFGGASDGQGTTPLDDTWVFDGTSWTPVASGPGAPHPSARVFPRPPSSMGASFCSAAGTSTVVL